MFSHLHNSTSGTCVVIGNGPSLKDVPVDWLSKYPTFGSNRVYLKYVPNYFVCVNPLVYRQWKDEILALPCTKFIVGDTEGQGFELKSHGLPLFSYTPYKWIYEGYTVTFVALQIAFFMGFTRVKLLGVDHKYVFNGKPNEEHTFEGEDLNHFDSSYFKGAQWNNPDLERSAEAYALAKEAFENTSRTIVNCTSGSELKVFPMEAFS